MRDLDVRLVRAFVAVAEDRSFTHAARSLHVAQPWLSVQIRKLEDQLGHRLFERNRNRQVELTDAAEALLPKARELLVAVERFQLAFRRLETDRRTLLQLGAPDFTAEIPTRIAIIDGFLAEYPGIELNVTNSWTVELLRGLREGQLDVALTVGPHVDPDLQTIVLVRHRFAVLAQAADFPGRPKTLPLRAFAGRTIAIFQRSVNPAFHDAIVPHLEAAEIHVGHLSEAGVIASIRRIERSGGMTLIGDYISDRMIPPSLVKINLPDSAVGFNLNIVTRADNRDPAVRSFLRHARRIAAL